MNQDNEKKYREEFEVGLRGFQKIKRHGRTDYLDMSVEECWLSYLDACEKRQEEADKNENFWIKMCDEKQATIQKLKEEIDKDTARSVAVRVKCGEIVYLKEQLEKRDGIKSEDGSTFYFKDSRLPDIALPMHLLEVDE
jgi:hypothetical protein